MEMLLKRILLALLIFTNSFFKTIFCIPAGVCRHTPTCSVYAQQCIQREKPVRALYLIVCRLLRCHPFASLPVHGTITRSLK